MQYSVFHPAHFEAVMAIMQSNYDRITKQTDRPSLEVIYHRGMALKLLSKRLKGLPSLSDPEVQNVSIILFRQN